MSFDDRVQINVRGLDKHEAEKLKVLAAELDMPVSRLVRIAIRRVLTDYSYMKLHEWA
jgi:Ribbon-helix-helix domain